MSYAAPDSLRAHVRHGIKTGLASVAALLAARAMGMHYGYWAALSAVIVMQVSVADSVRMGWYRFTGTAIGAAMGIAAILALPDTVFWDTAALFVAVSACAFMTRYNDRYRMAAITATIVIMASMGQSGRVLYGLERVVEIALGVACAFAVSVLVWPLRATETLRRRLLAHLAQAADYHVMLVDAFLDRQASRPPGLLDVYASAVAGNRARWRTARRHEGLIYRESTREIDARIDLLERCDQHLRSMLRSLNDVQAGEVAQGPGGPDGSPGGVDIIMADELREVARAVAEALDAAARDEAMPVQRLRDALDAADRRLIALRGQGVTRRLSLSKLAQVFSFYHAMRAMARDVLRHARHEAEPAPGVPQKAPPKAP